MLKRRLKEPFGKAGLTVAILALVLALVGGAYAAGGLTKSQEKQVTKIAKKYAGKPGANGANGSNGAPGEKGAKGDPGAPGEAGKNGKSVVIGNTSPVSCGTAGGKTVEVEGSGVKTPICNGPEGPEGTFGGQTLPAGKTLTGHWGGSGWGEAVATGFVVAPVSYALPLASALSGNEFFEEGEEPTGTDKCTGNAANPSAPKGYLCVYTTEESNVLQSPPLPIAVAINDSAGFTVFGATAAKGPVYAFGTWAVTGE